MARKSEKAAGEAELCTALTRKPKKPGPDKGHGGRPKFVKCDDQAARIREAAKVGCSLESIARIEGLPEPTVRKHYKEEIRTSFEKGKERLRSAQWKLAVEEGNARMLEWLGKQYLGQSDKVESKGDVDVRQEIAIKLVRPKSA